MVSIRLTNSSRVIAGLPRATGDSLYYGTDIYTEFAQQEKRVV
jgi:hypothetical protein